MSTSGLEVLLLKIRWCHRCCETCWRACQTMGRRYPASNKTDRCRLAGGGWGRIFFLWVVRFTFWSFARDGCALLGGSLTVFWHFRTIVACLLLHFWAVSPFGASCQSILWNLIGLWNRSPPVLVWFETRKVQNWSCTTPTAKCGHGYCALRLSKEDWPLGQRILLLALLVIESLQGDCILSIIRHNRQKPDKA